MKQTVLLFFLLACFSSCFQNAKKGHAIFKNVDPYQVAGKSQVINANKGLDIHINYNHIDKDFVINFSDIFDSIGYVKLESTPESMIGKINKLHLKDGFFYVLDTYKAKTLKKFSQHGEYVTSFGEIGPGPKELQEFTDFFVNDTEVIIYDQFKSKLFYYSLSGEFLFSKSIPFIAVSFFCFSDNEYIFHLFDSDNYHIPDILNYSILKTDSNFTIETKTAFREKDKYINFLAQNNIVFANNTFYYHPTFSDTIFSINRDGSLNCDYIFNFGKNSLPDALILKENERLMSKTRRDEEYVMFAGSFVPTRNFIHTGFTMQGYGYCSFYSIRTGKNVCGASYRDDMYYGFSLYNILTSIDDTLIAAVDAYGIKAGAKTGDFEKAKPLLPKSYLEFLDSIDDDDNPVIAFYRMKDQL